MSAVETLALQVAVVDAAVGGHEDVCETAGSVGPVHQAECQGRSWSSLQTVSVRLQERDGVTVTTPPRPATSSAQLERGDPRHRVTAPSHTADQVGGDHITVRGGLLHGQARGGGVCGGGGCEGGPH